MRDPQGVFTWRGIAHRMAQCPRIARNLVGAGWAAPYTVIGLLLGALVWCAGGRMRRVAGVCEVVCSPTLAAWLGRSGFAAVTLGQVVIGISACELDRLRLHEHAHVRQYLAWGPFFGPAYLGCALWLWLRGGQPHQDNPFERAARAAERPRGA